jgi:UDP-glucose 4-epimerase
MKVLITGKNSFVGNYVGPYLFDRGYQVRYLSLKDNAWIDADFSNFDAILHVAGIAHVSYKKKDKDLYDEVNHQLTKRVALKAKSEGVKQFIFLSSMIVYSSSSKKITTDTLPNPVGPYALSKLKAEIALNDLKSEDFKVAILRPSMVYGPGNKGNNPRLVKLIKTIPLFPRFKNQRSFLFIGNLAEATYQVINGEHPGTYHLADKAPISSTHLVEQIGRNLDKKIYLTRIFNPLIYLLKPRVMTLQKLFGDYFYDSALIRHHFEYHQYNFEEAMKLTLEGEHHG